MSLLSSIDLLEFGVDDPGGNVLETVAARAVSRAEAFCDRCFDLTQATDYLSPGTQQAQVRLQNFPLVVDEDHALTVLESAQDAQPTALTQGTDFNIDGSIGVLTRMGGTWQQGDRCVSVTYYAGYTDATLPGGLREAITELAMWMLRNRGASGVTQEAMDGHSETREALVRGVPASIAEMLAPYVRVTL